MLAPVMTLREGAKIYSPGGELLEAGDRLDQPGLANALEVVRDEGARTFYEGTIAETLSPSCTNARGLSPGVISRLPTALARARRY